MSVPTLFLCCSLPLGSQLSELNLLSTKMILEAAIINLTRNLDILSQKDGKSISSHDKLKEEGLICLASLIEKAPTSEYLKLINAKDYEILLGYLVNVLCQLAKNDKSKSIKLHSLSILLKLIDRLDDLHDSFKQNERCSTILFVKALPGVTSTLFKIIMSDTKLPETILTLSIRILRRVIIVAFSPCDHKDNEPGLLSEEHLADTCDNLAIRLTYLFEYVMSHNNDLPSEVNHEMVKLCEGVACKTKDELLKRALKSIVRYTAFVTSIDGSSQGLKPEIKLDLLLIADNIQDRIKNCDTGDERIDSVVLSNLFSLLDNLDSYCMTMLSGERISELSMLCGLLKLLPEDGIRTFLEITDKRALFIRTMTKLCEFATNQPFLFLTDTKVGDKALETTQKIYTVEKRFIHITEKEVRLIASCCHIIGQNADWFSLSDMIKSELRRFSDASNLFITYLILKGCLARKFEPNSRVSSLTLHLVDFYLDSTNEEYASFKECFEQEEAIHSQNIIKVVIATETLVTIVELNVKFSQSEAEKTIILKPLLCPLLNWSSSSSRAISEASLSALYQIGNLYGHDSIKSLIEANIDYIVDGVSHKLTNFSLNHEITNVLATTFKLSSMSSFYYFRDVYERIFELLGAYHHTEKAKSIVLLFYRTVSILNGWKEALGEPCLEEEPLTSESKLKALLYDLDISHRLEKLRKDILESQQFRESLERMELGEKEAEKQVLDDLKSGQAPMEEDREEVSSSQEMDEAKKNKPPEIVLTETIMKHCIGLISSNHSEIKILALKTAAHGFRVLRDDEDTLLPLVHQLWSPLVNRLTSDYKQNLEINLCAFECLVSMAVCAKDFIRARTLETIIPRICLFLETQARESKNKKLNGPYCMTIAYKSQIRILTHLGALAYHIQLAYKSLWRVVRTTLIYLDPSQVQSLREAARRSLHYLIALDSDCVWFYAKQNGCLRELPFDLIYGDSH